jgi:predicted amidohydrolase
MAVHLEGSMALIIAAAQSTSVPGDIPQNLERHLRFATLASDHAVHLLVFPELSLTGYEPGLAQSNTVSPDDPRLDALKGLAQKAHMTIVVGAPTMSQDQELHIGALALLSDGSVSTYSKQYLHKGEEGTFAPGPGGHTFEVGGAIVALAICADTSHPEHAAAARLRRASLYAAGALISENGYQADAALLEKYARDYRMTVLMANHGGPTGGWVPAGRSAIWSKDGNLVVASPGPGNALVFAREQASSWDGSVLPIVL